MLSVDRNSKIRSCLIKKKNEDITKIFKNVDIEDEEDALDFLTTSEKWAIPGEGSKHNWRALQSTLQLALSAHPP